jgi:hypothetical protein
MFAHTQMPAQRKPLLLAFVLLRSSNNHEREKYYCGDVREKLAVKPALVLERLLRAIQE